MNIQNRLPIAFFFTILILPVITLADGIILPPRERVFELSTIQERQQYAVVEVLSNYYQRTSMFLSLASLDGETRDVILLLPFESIPTAVDAHGLSSEEFLQKYKFDGIKELAKKQSFKGVVANTSPTIRDYLTDYLASMMLSPVYKLIGIMPRRPALWGAMGVAAAEKIGIPLPAGVEIVATYEFEGGKLELYNVTSGQVLGDFVREVYKLEVPEIVKKAVDRYQRHYIAALTLKVGPISDVSLLKLYAPNTFKKVKDWINAHPELTLKCWERFRAWEGIRGCTARSLLEEKLSTLIDEALEESKGKLKIQLPTPEGLRPIVKVKLLSTNDPFNRYLGIAINRQLGDNWWATGEYTCNYLIGPEAVGSVYECEVPVGTFQFAEASLSSSAGYRWDIRVIYPDNRTFSCNVDRKDRCPSREASPQQLAIKNQLLDFVEAAYSKKVRGIELSMTLPMKEGSLFYPLGTGMAWSIPIEDIRILVEMDKELVASLPQTPEEAVENGKRYYLYEFKNWNPDYDIAGKISRAGMAAKANDSWKRLLSTLYEKSGIAAVFWLVIILVGAGTSLYHLGLISRKNSTYLILGAILAPLISLWAFLLVVYGLRTKPTLKELKNNGILMLKYILSLTIILGIIALIAFATSG